MKSLINEISEIYTFEKVNLFNAVMKQIQGKHLMKNNDLSAKISHKEAINRLKEFCEYGRDSSINGFAWNAECNEFFEKHKDAIIAWLKDYAENLGFKSISELIANMQREEKFDLVEQLLYLDTSGIYINQNYTISLIVRQLVYEIACDFCSNLYEMTTKVKEMSNESF